MHDQKWQFLPYKVTFTEEQAGADKNVPRNENDRGWHEKCFTCR